MTRIFAFFLLADYSTCPRPLPALKYRPLFVIITCKYSPHICSYCGLNWEQVVTWLVLLFVLFALISDKIRFDGAALGGLLLLGLIGIAPASTLFSGFSSPILFTVAIVLVMSAGFVESGILTGFGQSIAKRIKKPRRQMAALMLFTTIIGGFVNNVGTVGIMLPTAQRMARRAGIPKANAGMWLVYITILGGSFTLIGTAW